MSLENLLKFANHNYILNLSAPLNGIRKDDFERLHYASIFEFFYSTVNDDRKRTGIALVYT